MSEEWRVMVDHPRFLVSSEGRVASLDGRILKQWVTRKGYAQIATCDNGKAFTFKVHREVARAFVPAISGKTQVNHKDGNKLNNCVENLEWCSPKENSQHAYRVLGHKNEPRNEIAVVCVETGREYRSLSAASRETGLTRPAITNACKSQKRTSGGFHWRFKDKEE